MNDRTYDTLKQIVQIVLPALATLYAALAGLWGFPFAEQVVGTITALATFLGVVLKVSSRNYYSDQDETVIDYDNDEDDGEDDEEDALDDDDEEWDV